MTKPGSTHLTWRHPKGETFRLLPRHGEPFSIYEWVAQKTIKFVAYLPIYITLFIFLTIATMVWVIPFLEDCTWL